MTIHGLIFWCFEGFLIFTYGAGRWRDIMRELDLGYDSFEPLFRYDVDLANALVTEAARQLDKPADTLLEDFGTFLVTDERVERVRRLLRFGGVNYTDFLHSLEDLRGRAQLAVPDLDLPEIEVDEITAEEFQITCRNLSHGVGYILLGVLRALADDYGALAYLEHLGRQDQCEKISVQLLEMRHGKGRAFHLAAEGMS
ncbi:heme NO-binding domain-containing protein [Aliiroseovarius sp. S1339]|uniref:heme NO-binding domain-containing protein n=1 Tax=Aliiroseovarius sp. S1339 TaxID=2936990 RepID=UPI0020BFC2DA|nr:heme NO-binding domain-containing protein [Aliiroseovarius sp. S1339]MCK8463865.1 heme NO-binding domain-containing protein [Aliiroseovarius sp. S1339]